ncbi:MULTISPECIES: hypothetical protein [unclassified Bradyrhizobium]|uniref:hypothetical protein n=1 Tax=unclassified Bradyrhizobium TaxID=2631580 RepID=UPI0028F1607A|nr:MULTISPECIES: hypothetical protein [unclassified Bradyrhizobium]
MPPPTSTNVSAKVMCKKLIQGGGGCTGDIGRKDMVTASLRMRPGFETRSGEFGEIVEAAKQSAATTTAMALAARGPKQLFSGRSPHAPCVQQACDVTGIGDALEARRHKTRRCPDQTVQQCLEISCDELGTAKIKSMHDVNPYFEQRSKYVAQK